MERRQLEEAAFLVGMGKTLYNLWDNIPQLYELLADIQPNSEKLLQYLSQTELDALLALGKDTLANGLLVLSDEPLL